MRPGDTITGVSRPQNSVLVVGMEQIVQRSQQGVRAEVCCVLRRTASQKFYRVSQSMSSAQTAPTGAQIVNAFNTLEAQLLTIIQAKLDSL